MKVLELKGYKSIRAMQAFHGLMLGLKMLPAYMGETYEDFYERITQMPERDKEKMIREAVAFVEIPKEEVEAIVCFCSDANNVPYTAENMKQLGPRELHEIIVAVCMSVARIKIDLVSEGEKKKYPDGVLTSEESTPGTQVLH